MFVDIADFKSALAVENILTPYKKGRLSSDKKTRMPKEKITQRVCMEGFAFHQLRPQHQRYALMHRRTSGS